MTTIHRRLYSGTGFPLSNGSGQAITIAQDVASLEQAIFDVVTDIRAVLGGPSSTIDQDIANVYLQTQGVQTYVRGTAALLMLGGFLGPEFPLTGAGLALIDQILTDIGTSGATNADVLPVGPDVRAIHDGTQPVALPDPPPSGYGGGSASEVWQEYLDGSGVQAGRLLAKAGALALNLEEQGGVLLGPTPFFSLSGNIAAYPGVLDYPSAPTPDWADLIHGETRLAWLQRTDPVYADAWIADPTTGDPVVQVGSQGLGSYTYIRMLLSEPEFQALSATTVSGGAPVWPGILAVTLGTPVAFDDLLQVDEPMDGVIVAYTTPPQKVSVYSFGLYTAYGRAGQIVFVSDNGQAEEEQWLQFDQALYTPKSMARAASCIIRPLAGQEGTITPWTVT